MEEQKLEAAKAAQPKEAGQATAEQLKNYCDQLLSQRNQLAQRLNAVQNVLNKLPFLFKVIENSDKFEASFVDQCATEIVEIMTPPIEEPEGEDTVEEVSKD